MLTYSYRLQAHSGGEGGRFIDGKLSFTLQHYRISYLLQAAEVAERCYDEARKELDAQAVRMDRIDAVTSRLKMVMKIGGTTVAQVSI